jgi:hypothetical protein
MITSLELGITDGVSVSLVLHKYLRMQNISWTDRMKNKDVLHRGKEEINNLHKIKRTAN